MDIGDRNVWGWDFVVLAVFCLLVWVVVWMYFYYSLQLYTYFRYLYISQLKGTKSLKHLTAIDYSVTQYCVKTQLMVCWKLFSFPPNGVKISSFCSPRWVWNWLLFSSQYNAGLVSSVGGGTRSCRDHQRLDFQMDLGLDFDFIPLMALLQSQFFSC